MERRRPQPRPAGSAPRRGNEPAKPRKRKPGRASSGISLVLTAALVFVFVSTYMVSGLSARLQTPEVATVTPAFGNVAPPTVFTGVIVRDETVYTAGRTGIVEFQAAHLERVRPGQSVATISEEAYVADIVASIEDLDRLILEMQARRGEISAFSADVTRMNDQLQNSVDTHLPRLTGSNFGELHDFADNARRLLTLRNQMLLTEGRGSVRDMAGERERAVERLGSNVETVTVQRGGILSYVVDGLEDILTIENKRNLTPEQTRQSVDFTTLHRPREAARGDDIFKIVNSNTWYIAAYLPFEAVSQWQVNNLRRVYLQSGDTFHRMETYVEYLNHGQSSSFVILRVSRFLHQYMDRRGINFRLSNVVRDSLLIPAHVVTSKDAVRLPAEYVRRADALNPYVLRRTGENDQTSPLDVYRRTNESVYALTSANNLTIGDTIIHPDDPARSHIIGEIIRIHGVFVLNFGFADFIEITPDDDAPAVEGHIVLEASANRRLTPSSRIILDTTGLRDGQRLLAY